jgi:hypothetical protein
METSIKDNLKPLSKVLMNNKNNDEIDSNFNNCEEVTLRKKLWRDLNGEEAIGQEKGWVQLSPYGLNGRTETEASYMILKKSIYRAAWQKC